jgi:hypothetical protein
MRQTQMSVLIINEVRNEIGFKMIPDRANLLFITGNDNGALKNAI